MRKNHLLASGLMLVASSTFADVIFSEYIEGSSNNKALELMNTGSESVSLSGYSIELYSNGKLTVQNSVNLSGSLAAGKVYVISNPSAVGAIQDVTDITSTVTYFNGNDVLLLKYDGTVVDRIGQLGNSDKFGADVTLVRKATITTGDNQYDTAFDPSIQWDSHPKDTFDYLGNADGNDNPDNSVDMACHNPATLISEIQGNSDSSALDGQTVVVEAIVTADLQNSNEMKGFFIQEEDADTDVDTTTSEGLFVYNDNADVVVGDKVRLYATVDEYYGLTELTQVQQLTVCSQDNILPTPASFDLPVTASSDFEAVEGMQVQFASTMTVNEVYNLGRYGEFMIGNGRRPIPTDVAEPGSAAQAIAQANALNRLLVEDGISSQNPDPVIFPAPMLDAVNTLRVGNSVDNLTGVMNYAYGAYKLIPTETPVFNNTNPRTAAPEAVEGSNFRAASFNVLNYFNGDGEDGAFPTPRGASTAFELQRQTDKLIAAITALDADVIGLMELENDGYGELSAIASLTAALNTELPEGKQYAYVHPDVAQIGDDAIAVGMIYRPATVSLVGSSQILNSANSPLDESGNPLFIDDLNRPTLVQSIRHNASGSVLTIAVNHLKSKGSNNCDNYQDCDNGQGAYNNARTSAATALAQWLADDPTGTQSNQVLILGDLNAYSKEDPVAALLEANYTLLQEDNGYSYVYNGETGTLDHALVSPSLLTKVLNVQHWHINTDEPRVLDYNTEYKSEAQILSMYAADAYRSSDHDPVAIDFQMNQPPVAKAQIYSFLFWYVFVSESSDADGEIVDEVWQVGDHQVSGSWFALPKWIIHSQHINQISLTVYDNNNASDTTTATIGCFYWGCGQPNRTGHWYY
jgi:uncharacterized protein